MSLFLCHQFADAESILILYREYFIVNGSVQYLRNEAGADTLNLVSACGSFGQNRRGCRLYSDYFHVRILFFQIFTGSGDGSAGSYACYEDVNGSVGILPDLRTGGLKVDLRVGRVYKLAGDKAVRDLFCLP